MEELRHIKPFMTEMRPFMTDTAATLQRIEENCAGLDSRLADVEQKVSDVQDVIAQVATLTKEVNQLKRTAEDLENRNRRNNLHVYGIPENSEGSDMITFLKAQVLPITGLPKSLDLNIQRAHRLGPKNASSSSKPRGIIAYFLLYSDLMAILNAVKQHKQLMWAGHRIFFSQDVSKPTANRRKEFLDLRPALRSMNARYGLIHPCFFKVTYKDRTVSFEDPADLRKFINSHKGESMELTHS